jgi:hypothetical protein
MNRIRSLAFAGLCALLAANCGASTIVERFSANPFQNGWQLFGDTNLFAWDPARQKLNATWDSTQTNSYFYLPLGKTLTITDSFCVQFDLQLSNAVAFNSGSELAVGLLHLSDATSTNFSRADLMSPNLFEFDYFPAYVYAGTPYPASVDATFIDANINFYFAFDNLTLNSGTTYRVLLIHQAGAAVITGQVFLNGQVVSSFPSIYSAPLGNFQLDALAVENYADDGFGDSIFAQGTVDNLAVAVPLPVGQITLLAAGTVRFASDAKWLYTLEQSSNVQSWSPAAPIVPGNGTNLVLQATNPPAGGSFYRVRADLP